MKVKPQKFKTEAEGMRWANSLRQAGHAVRVEYLPKDAVRVSVVD